MLKVETPTGTPQKTKPRERCCTDEKCDPFALRNNYFEGKPLTPASFRVEQDYSLQHRRLLNRAIHGWGVVYGFAVTQPVDQGKRVQPLLAIDAGFALDQCGRELVQAKRRDVAIDDEDLLWLDEDFGIVSRDEAVKAATERSRETGTREQCWLLSAHYAERDVDPVDLRDSCRCEHREWDRTCETVRYSLRNVPCSTCCDDFDCELTCKCGSGPCCEPRADEAGRKPKDAPPRRGGCGCACTQTGLPPDDCERGLCDVEETCGRVEVDTRHGVPLACLSTGREEGRTRGGIEIEACGPRRLVKRNDLLYDLIRGCDLTRISDFGWKAWHRDETPMVPFDRFSEALGEQGSGRKEYVTRLFWVTFSRPVRKNTLQPDAFAMTVLVPEREGGWWETLRVPIVRVETTAELPDDPDGHVRGARIVVDGPWLEDAVRGPRSRFLREDARIEIEVRGDFIVDCNGQTVDANARGLAALPTGNGTPGGTFLSAFRVEARDVPRHEDQRDPGDRLKGAAS